MTIYDKRHDFLLGATLLHVRINAGPSPLSLSLSLELTSSSLSLFLSSSLKSLTITLIFCAFQCMNKVSVRWLSRTLTPELWTSFWRNSQTIWTWPSKNLFHNLLFSMKRRSTILILSQNNKACNRMNESVKIVISLHHLTPFFHVVCKQPTAAKMHKIFIIMNFICHYGSKHSPKVVFCLSCSEPCYYKIKKQILF